MTDKRFAKIMIFSMVNTMIMGFFIYTTPYETMLYLMVSTLVFNVFVSREEEK